MVLPPPLTVTSLYVNGFVEDTAKNLPTSPAVTEPIPVPPWYGNSTLAPATKAGIKPTTNIVNNTFLKKFILVTIIKSYNNTCWWWGSKGYSRARNGVVSSGDCHSSRPNKNLFGISNRSMQERKINP